MNMADLTVYWLVTEHGEVAETSFFDYIINSNVLNVVIALLFLAWVAKKFNLLGLFEQQRSKIAGEVEAVEAQKQKALNELEEIRQRTAKLDKEVEAILAEAQQSAEALSTQIIENAKEEAEKIIELSKKRVELEQRAAAKSVEQRLLQDSLQEARIQLAESLSKDEQKESVAAFIEALSQQKS